MSIKLRRFKPDSPYSIAKSLCGDDTEYNSYKVKIGEDVLRAYRSHKEWLPKFAQHVEGIGLQDCVFVYNPDMTKLKAFLAYLMISAPTDKNEIPTRTQLYPLSSFSKRMSMFKIDDDIDENTSLNEWIIIVIDKGLPVYGNTTAFYGEVLIENVSALAIRGKKVVVLSQLKSNVLCDCGLFKSVALKLDDADKDITSARSERTGDPFARVERTYDPQAFGGYNENAPTKPVQSQSDIANQQVEDANKLNNTKFDWL